MSICRWSQDVIFVDLPENLERHHELQTVITMLREGRACNVVVDFSQVQVVGAAAWAQLQKIQKLVHEGGHKLTLCHVAPALRGIFTIARRDDLFEFAEDRFAALMSPRRAGSTAREEEGRLRVLLADDHEIVRQGLASLLGDGRTVEVVGQASNGREAVDLAGRLHPDVVIMDVSMPIMSGEEATRQIKKDLPQTRVITLSMWEEPAVREKMYQAGAESYVLKTAPTEELLAAIRGKDAAATLDLRPETQGSTQVGDF